MGTDSVHLILASASPRRKDLLTQAGVSFRVEVAQVEEREDKTGDPAAMVCHNAELKAAEVAGRFPGEWVLGADTTVALGDRILGKPSHEEEAFAMLRLLAGKTHHVHTGVCLIRPDGSRDIFAESTSVTFRELPDVEIRRYLRDVPVLDKAGAYALQDQGERIVEQVEGSRSNVIGLPVEAVVQRIG